MFPKLHHRVVRVPLACLLGAGAALAVMPPAAATTDAGAGTAAAQAAEPVPVPVPPVPPSTPPEALARYVGQVSCETTVKPGTTAFRQTLVDTYGPSTTVGTLRACTTGGASEHKQGRALDWMLDASAPADAETATAFLTWLTGPDADGVAAGNARRLGVMYVIWNKSTWQSWTGAWKPYTGASPHTDHIHISLSWDGAMKRTSWWTGVATTRYDYGPCQKYIGELAPAYTAPNYTPCPDPVPRPALAFPRLWDADRAADVIARSSSGALLLYPGNGSGGFGRMRQIGSGWNGMNVVTAAGDFDKNGRRDLVARDGSGRLFLYSGNGTGGFAGSRQIGWGWGGMDAVLGVGDLDMNGTVDVLARRASDGVAILYPGNGAGGFSRPRTAGDLRGLTLVTAVGDWDGDTRPDVVSRDSAGRLLLHPSDGARRLGPARAIGTGWGQMTSLVGTGDFTGDGRPDLAARRSDGTLWVYLGNGTGGFAGVRQVGSGWSSLTLAG